ncbi:conserved hypothetical protein [Ricinus communis]|uniref:Uncharacterized protein n=1 Tax=Ricinus communis TaxID=3988 RepID=B9S557_RICCO|nr:conserved hypothetical protein [Ricinus communis]
MADLEGIGYGANSHWHWSCTLHRQLLLQFVTFTSIPRCHTFRLQLENPMLVSSLYVAYAWH